MNRIFIIGEVGINANGNVGIVRKLINIVADSGADAIKFQKRYVPKCYTKEELDKPRESPWGATTRKQKLGLEFTEEEYVQIDLYCAERGVKWFVSCWDLNSVELIKQFDLKYNKIPSPRLGHIELLNAIAKQRKYTFISTGMSTLQEIENAVNIFRKYDCPFTLMHCNSQYPMPVEDANMLMIPTLKKLFNCSVGYSGHSPSIIDAIVAVCLGATSIEKHITTDRTQYGSDQPSSLEPHGLFKTVEYIRDIEKMFGDGIKKITPPELKIREKLWRDEDVKT